VPDDSVAGPHRVAVLVQRVLLGVPEILVPFVRMLSPVLLLLLLLLLQGGETFLFLVSRPRSLGAFATDEERRANDQANELKLFHMFTSVRQIR
jgi:hypothetical protein